MKITTEYARDDDLMNETLYVDDSILMSERIENSREKFLKWKEASKVLKLNL